MSRRKMLEEGNKNTNQTEDNECSNTNHKNNYSIPRRRGLGLFFVLVVIIIVVGNDGEVSFFELLIINEGR